MGRKRSNGNTYSESVTGCGGKGARGRHEAGVDACAGGRDGREGCCFCMRSLPSRSALNGLCTTSACPTVAHTGRSVASTHRQAHMVPPRYPRNPHPSAWPKQNAWRCRPGANPPCMYNIYKHALAQAARPPTVPIPSKLQNSHLSSRIDAMTPHPMARKMRHQKLARARCARSARRSCLTARPVSARTASTL